MTFAGSILTYFKKMPTQSETNDRLRGMMGSGFAAWVMVTGAMFAPEWTRQGEKHCGVIFCCNTTYGDCSITDGGESVMVLSAKYL